MNKLIKWYISERDKEEKTDNFIKARVYSDCKSVCEDVCPYSGLCQNIPDPRDIENSRSSLLDFCTECSNSGEYFKGDENLDFEEDVTIIPTEGSVEEFFEKHGVDLHQSYIQRNPKVEIKTIIDKVCKGWCSSYDPSYCNCKSTNYTCILKNLFEN